VRRDLIEEEMIRLPAPEPLSLEDSLMDADHLPKERKKPGRKKGWSKAMDDSNKMYGNSSSSTKSGNKGPGKGSIAQLIPDALLPELCRQITANGTRIRDEIIKQFTTDHPEASIRQCLIKFQELTTKFKPDCVPQPEKASGRAWVFFLRPRFYHLLPEDERPIGWEAEAAKDEELYVKECEEKEKAKEEEKEKAGAKTQENEDDDTSNVYASTIGTDDDSGDEHLAKKMKLN
jgi:hypothetical protein